MNFEPPTESNALSALAPSPDYVAASKWELKELKPMHRQVASLVAQGMRNVDVATLVGITPEYVCMLLRQPLVQAYVAEISAVANTRLEAMFEKSVEVIADVLEGGTEKGKLAAVRLQLEATKRIGRPDPSARPGEANTDRLEKLAERLIMLQSGVRQGLIKPGEEIIDV